MRALLAVVATLLLSTPVAAAAAEDFACGSSIETNALVREAAVWSAARAQAMASKGLATASAAERDGVFIVPADLTNSPFLNPFDLTGRTLIFQREGATRFAMRNNALEWDSNSGALVPLQGSTNEAHATVSLDFDFPFFDRTVRTVYVTGSNAIFLNPPVASELRQYGDAELATHPEAVIAPLMTTRASRLGSAAQVYVRKDGDTAAITWLASDRYMVRATLNRSGEIRFSYNNVDVPPAASAVVITSGTEAWRTTRTSLGSTNDVAGDWRVTVPAAMAPMLDISRVSVERVAGLDLYELRVRTDGAVNAPMAGETLQYTVVVNGQTFRLTALSDGRTRASIPVWGQNFASSLARIDGNEVVITFLGEHVADVSSISVIARAYRGSSLIDTSPALSVALPAPARRTRTDFSSTTTRVFDREPIVEAFSLPVLSVARVWDQVKAANPSLNDQTIDGVAIYQNFYTDLVTYAGAYSTGGNAGAAGLARGDGDAPFQPREPALMHMNTIGYGHNRTSPGASRVVLHELGHRWLLFASLAENGANTFTLNPVSAHPAQYVDTRAAFNVYTSKDTSVMGGGYFTDNANGTFTTAEYGPYGYSWLDLYLMGLAGPAEVPTMFYIANSSPQLGGEYYAPPNQTYTGTRRDFNVQQVIDATGNRNPVYPATQRDFRVVFVLLADPRRDVTDAELEKVQLYRSLMERDFATATDRRGSVSTAIEASEPPSGPRRRAVRR